MRPENTPVPKNYLPAHCSFSNCDIENPLQNEVHIGGFREKLPLNDSKKVLKSILCLNALRDGGGGGGGEMGLG